MTRCTASVIGLAADSEHRFSKMPRSAITLVRDLGVRGDAHAGLTVQHLSRIAKDPSQPNLRQVHLLASEFFDEARAHGYELAAGNLGENILTRGIDLLGLPRGAMLRLGRRAVVRVTGLRNPCRQIDDFRSGLLKIAVKRGEDGTVVRRAGIMAVVATGGNVRLGDVIEVILPPEPHDRLEPV
ncbi:MAG TPA: MOSC domain-containing protein [Streptosporangiaceae bacterium]|nr:MOSC domain-containing protein [Streptosporangiaceae bacterium]